MALFGSYRRRAPDPLARIESKLDAIYAVLEALIEKEIVSMASMDDLVQRVQRNSDVTQSAVTLINGLRTELRNAAQAGDMQRVKQLCDDLDRNSGALAEAVTQGTDAAQSGGGAAGGTGGTAGGATPAP